ncbi:MAG: hypothetical protein ACTSU7_00595 [Candidatus Heimdallarchaeaceae archaeon]
MEKEENKYLLGYCSNKDCSEYNGGWKYPLNFSEDDQVDCYCPGCGEALEFIIQEDKL